MILTSWHSFLWADAADELSAADFLRPQPFASLAAHDWTGRVGASDLGESRLLEHRQGSSEDGRGCRGASECGNIDGMAVEQRRAVVERPLDGAAQEGHPESGAGGTYCPSG